MPYLFPDIYPTTWEPDWERYQERDTARSSRLQINSYDPTHQWSARGVWEMADRAEYDQIEEHWWLYATSTFDLFNFRLRKLRDVWIAVADGTSTIYTLPAKEVVTPTIKHNGVTAGTQPALLVGTGGQGEDQIQYTALTKPAAGVIITVSAPDGRQRFEVNYGNMKFTDRHREADLWIVEATFVQDVFV